MTRVLLDPYPERTDVVGLGFMNPNTSLPTQQLCLGLGPMTFALSLKLKYENSSVTAI